MESVKPPSRQELSRVHRAKLQSQPGYVYLDDLSLVEKEFTGRIVRVTDFSTHFDATDKPYVMSQLAIPPLCDSPHEVWVCGAHHRVEYERSGQLEIAHTQDLTLLRIVVPELTPTELAELGTDRTSLSYAGYNAYSELFAYIKKHKLGQLIRIWNYVPQILTLPTEDVPVEDRERYRQFNIGRYDAWQDFGPRDEAGDLMRPAATGIGTHNGPLVIEAVIGTGQSFYIDNPRQIPAYHYPPKYGSKAPAFSRGTLHYTDWGSEMFVSGTASIVGSETVHLGDPVKQVHETFTNIKTLIGKDNLSKYDHSGFELDDLTGVRVYIKNPDQYHIIRREVEKYLHPHTPVTYLNNDICRPDLLLEIEGVARKSN